MLPTYALSLPKRYENLMDAAKQHKADLTRIIRKVPDATVRVEQLLRQVNNSKMGRLELFLGQSGSGKTTFLSSLPRFYEGAHVTPLPATIDLIMIPDEIQRKGEPTIENQIFVILDQDNPTIDAATARRLFEKFRRLFRTREGRSLIIWPITDDSTAKMLAQTAWEIGSDSIVDLDTKGIYKFLGLPKSEYYDVAEITTRSLNMGQGLEAYGLGTSIAAPLMQESGTLSQFFGRLESKSQEINNRFGDTLKERHIPSIWILVGGDDTRELSLTVANLTQGTEKRVDIDRIIAVLDAPESKTGYLEEWRRRRDEVAYLLRRLDVRIFELPPNVSVSAFRAFGDESIKSRMKKKVDNAASASRSVQSARFFQFLINATTSSSATIRPAIEDTANDYKRVQVLAGKNDKPLNKALAEAVKKALQDVGASADVTAEQRKLDARSNLQPDIMVNFVDGRVICLEPTWRTKGTAIPGELTEQQSSMTVGHIQQYLLAKMLEYVKDLGL